MEAFRAYQANGQRQLEEWSLDALKQPQRLAGRFDNPFKKLSIRRIMAVLNILDDQTRHRVKKALRTFVEKQTPSVGKGARSFNKAVAEELKRLLNDDGPAPDPAAQRLDPDKLAAARAWRAGEGQTSVAHFMKHYATLPMAQRPFTDEIRLANQKYYEALARHQSREGGSIGDLFPTRPEAIGGAIRQRIDLTPEEALAKIEHRRAQSRERMRAMRAERRRAKPSTG